MVRGGGLGEKNYGAFSFLSFLVSRSRAEIRLSVNYRESLVEGFLKRETDDREKAACVRGRS